MSLILLPQKPELKTYYIHWHDGQCFEIKAGSYFKGERTYVFVTLTHDEMHKAYMKGTLLGVPPVLEIDHDVVLMIVDQDHYKRTMLPPTPVQLPKTRKPAAVKSVKKKA